MRLRVGIAVLCVGLTTAGAVGCVGTDSDDEPEETGVEMTVDIHDDADIDGMRFTAFECGEEEPVFVDERALDDMTLPEGMPEYTDAPFDKDSEHLFAHYSEVVDPGCYDVMVEPIDRDGQLVDDCRVAMAEDVEVVKDKTTELLLVSQCDGPEDVAGEIGDERLDVTGAVNHPPEIQQVEAQPSTTLTCPETTLELCTKVTEPDADPVAFDWLQLEGPDPVTGPDETYFVQDGTKVEKCVEYELADETADYLFELTVYDYFMLGKDDPITAEQWYKQESYGKIESRDTITMPISVECPEDVLPEPPPEDKKDKKDQKKYEDKKDDKDKDEKKAKKDDEEDVLPEPPPEDEKDEKDKEEEKEKEDVLPEPPPEKTEKEQKKKEKDDDYDDDDDHDDNDDHDNDDDHDTA